MKLNIGQNLRRLRREADMTQDELAEKLGVTFQSVSRWENDTTYPDMELLPVIADIFSVTVDHLMSVGAEDRRKQLEETTECFMKAVKNRENTAVLRLLHELRRDLRLYETYDLNLLSCIWTALRWYRNEIPAEILETARVFFNEYTHYIRSEWNRQWAVQTMAVIEDDEHLVKFLAEYCNAGNTEADDYLAERYMIRGETEKYEAAMEVRRYSTLAHFFQKQDKALLEPNIAYLHSLHGVTPDPAHPISGDGSIDLWFETRKYLGYRYAEYLIEQGEKDRAFVVLYDIISMMEKLMDTARDAKLGGQPVFELRDSSSILPDYRIKGVLVQIEENGKIRNAVRLRYSNEITYVIVFSPGEELLYYKNIFGWRIGDDPRYAELSERLESMISA